MSGIFQLGGSKKHGQSPSRRGDSTTAPMESSYRHFDDDDDMSIQTMQTYSTTGGIDVISDTKATRTTVSKALSKVCGRIVTKRAFKYSSTACILINSALLGLATFDFVQDNEFRKNLFHASSVLFLVLAFIELSLQLCFHQLSAMLEGFVLFDLAVILAAWFGHMPSLLVIRLFRVVRTLRLATSIPQLPSLTRALLRSMPSMFVIALLLGILFYIAAVVFTELFGSLYEEGQTSQDYFSRLDVSLFSLFQVMTLDDWGSIAKEAMNIYSWAWIPFVAFVISSSLFFLNLTIAVVVEAVSHEQRVKDAKLAHHEDAGTAPTMMADIARVEHKLDELTSTVEALVRMQAVLLQQQQQPQQQRESSSATETRQPPTRASSQAGSHVDEGQDNSNNNTGT